MLAISQPPPTLAILETQLRPEILYAPTEQVKPFNGQPRDNFEPTKLLELAESIEAQGQLVPAIVKRLDPPQGQYIFELVDGQRRLEACKIKQIKFFMVMIQQGQLSLDEQYLRAVVANYFREPLTTMEIARAIVRQEQMGFTKPQIAKRMGGKSITWAYQHVSLLKLHPDIQALLGPPTPEAERVPWTNALRLVELPHSQQLEVMSQIRTSPERLSANQARHMILKTAVKAGVARQLPRAELTKMMTFVRRTNREIESWLDHGDSLLKKIVEASTDAEKKVYLKRIRDTIEGFEMFEEEIKLHMGIAKPKKEPKE